jgi:flagellar basal-body rod modification protein FlgD
LEIANTLTTTNAASTITAAQVQNEPAAISSDFDTFLQMLTVQLKNQDPLNPVEGADYAVQLATFSGVEQQVQTNDLLRDLAAQMSGTGIAQLATWVGKEARVVAPAVFDGGPITVSPEIAEGATAAELVVFDSGGFEMQRIAIGVSGTPLEWAGVTADGAPFPSGQYSFKTESYEGETSLGTVSAAIYDKVIEARTDNGIPSLIMQSGATVSANDITALRDIL